MPRSRFFSRGSRESFQPKTEIQKINEAALALVASANAEQRGMRQVTQGTTLRLFAVRWRPRLVDLSPSAVSTP